MLEIQSVRTFKKVIPNIPSLFSQPNQITLDSTIGYRCNTAYQDTIYEDGYVKTNPAPANLLIQVPGIAISRIRGIDGTFRLTADHGLGDCYMRIFYTDITTGEEDSVRLGGKDQYSSSEREKSIYHGYDPTTYTTGEILTNSRLRLKPNHICTKIELWIGKTPQYPTIRRGVKDLVFYYK